MAEASLEKRIAFLRSQDIPEEDIQTALSQAEGLDEGSGTAEVAAHHKPRRKKKKKMKKKKAAAALNPAAGTSFLSCVFCQK